MDAASRHVDEHADEPTPLAPLASDPDQEPAALCRLAERQAAVVALGQRALSGMDLGELLERATALLKDQLALDYCQIWELQPDGDRLLLRAGVGWRSGMVGSYCERLDRATQPGYTLLTGEPVVVADTSSERRFRVSGFLAEQGVASGLGVRIPGPGVGFGAIGGHTRSHRGFSDEDTELLESVANVLGSAIERRRSERRLAEAEDRFRTLVERLPGVTYVAELGAQGRCLYVSPQVEAMLGYTPEQWQADPGLWLSRVHPDDRTLVAAAELTREASGEPLQLEYRIRARDNRMLWVRDEASASSAEGDPRVEGFITDITEERCARDELRYQAEHDVLTGLFNRRHFEQELERRRCAPAPEGGAVTIVDIDEFKFVNDSLGHKAGDAVVRGVSAALRREAGDGMLMARLGGDEFAILMPDADAREAQRCTAELLEAVRRAPTRAPVTASAGITVFEAASSASAGDLLVAADIALYEAKDRGRDRAVLFTGREGERLAWVGRVRRAIAEERLVLHSQPIFDLRSRKQVAEELLVRLIDEKGQIVPPGEFLPVAERSGLIREIDRWVVARAVELVAHGRRVSLNLSARSLADTDLTRLVRHGLQESGADPARMIFEITETGTTADNDQVRAFAERVERLGCGLALDDFGTGFGFLTYLKHLPIGYLKIDRGLVRELAGSPTDQRIVKSVLAMTEGLGIRSVAEGVEDAAALELLSAYGVDLAQGFHLGRPGPLQPT